MKTSSKIILLSSIAFIAAIGIGGYMVSQDVTSQAGEIEILGTYNEKQDLAVDYGGFNDTFVETSEGDTASGNTGDTASGNTFAKQDKIMLEPSGKIINSAGSVLYSPSTPKTGRRGRRNNSFTINHINPKIDIHNDKYDNTNENTVKTVQTEPVSTFSIDVDTASYSNVRGYLERGDIPPKNSIRIEEMINYFSYQYPLPETKEKPFAVHTTLTDSPWKKGNQLLHIGIKGFELQETEKKPLNLVLLIDTSGSMYGEDRIGLLQKGFNLLADQLTDKDTLSIVTYSGDSRVALEPTKGNEKQKIKNAINALNTGGGTWGAGGLKQAYALAKENYNPEAVNRILLGTDGDFNIGSTDNLSLEEFVKKEKENGIYLSVLSVGRGNYNDSLTQAIAQAGNGMAYYLDSFKEAKKVLLNDISKTIFPIANDVKIQVEFNPAKVAEYRLIGYETRALNREDFNNDKVDAGEIGSGHSVTAIYELTPVGSQNVMNDELRYAQNTDVKAEETSQADEYAFVKVRYKLPNEKTSLLIEQPVKETVALNNTSDDVRFSIAVAGFAQNLKDSKFKGEWSYDEIISFAKEARGADEHGYRNEFIELIDLTKVSADSTIH